MNKSIIYIVLGLLMTISLHAQVDRSKQPNPGPSPKVNLGKPQEFVLPNGLKVLVVENHKLPRVTFSLVLDNLPSVEGNLKGIDALTSAMLGSGTSKISKDDFNDQLDFYGSSVSFSVNSVSGNTLSKYFSNVLDMVAMGMLDPLFTQSDLDSEKAKLIDGIRSGEKSPTNISGRVRGVLLYGKDHPKGEYVSEESVNNITLNDVKDYYKKYFVPENAYLIVVGDVSFDEVKKQVTKDFSSWKKMSAPVSTYTDPTNLSTTEIDFVDVPNAVQSVISVNSIVDLKMTDPDFFAAIMANAILGGGADGYLFMNLREAHGWTYGSYSSISGRKYVSAFAATAEVRNAVTDSSVVEILSEIKRIRTTLPTREVLDIAKAKYIGNFVMNAEKPGTIAGFALQERTQSLPADFYENYIKNINAVTLEQVRVAAEKYFSNQSARIVIVGKASEVLQGLEKLNIPIKYFDKYGNPTAKPEEKAIDSNVTVESILNKYIDAVGGKESLESIKNLSATYEGEMQGQKLVMKQLATNDGKRLLTIEAMGMTLMKNVINGKTGYMESQGKRKDMTSDEVAEFLKYGTVFPELLMLNSTTLKLDGTENINDSDAYRLVDGDNSYLYDINSGLKVSQGLKKEVAPGQVVNQTTSFNEYKDIEGIKYPATISLNVGIEIKLELKDLKVNETITDSIFD